MAETTCSSLIKNAIPPFSEMGTKFFILIGGNFDVPSLHRIFAHDTGFLTHQTTCSISTNFTRTHFIVEESLASPFGDHEKRGFYQEQKKRSFVPLVNCVNTINCVRKLWVVLKNSSRYINRTILRADKEQALT